MVLPGVVRKVSTAFILLSLAGWITFGVGFGFRNFEYSKEEILSRGTAYPEFTCLWLFGVSAPILFVLSVLDLFCAYRLTTLLTYLILPVYLVSAGGVLFLNGLAMYQFHQLESFKDDHNLSSLSDITPSRDIIFNDTNLRLVVVDASRVTSDFSLIMIDTLDIHGSDNYIPIEFAGIIVAVLFHWIYLMLTPFFTQKDYDLDD